MSVTVAQYPKDNLPAEFYLEQNNPNPFKKLTTIKVALPCKTKVTVIITNSYGRVVDKLISKIHDPGMYELQFFAEGLPRGTYFFHLIADQFSESKEMELTK